MKQQIAPSILGIAATAHASAHVPNRVPGIGESAQIEQGWDDTTPRHNDGDPEHDAS